MGYLFRTGSAFITSVFVARYLGPEQFGEMNYVFSFVILFSMLSGTCFDQFLRREFVNTPDRTGDFLGTALTLKLFGAVGAIGLVFIFGVIPADDLQTRWLLGIYSISLIFMTTSLSQILLEAHLKSKYVTISEFFQLGVFLVLKLLFVYRQFPLWTFVALQSTEVVLKGGIQFAWIARLKICPNLSVSKKTAHYLLKESWPYFLTGGAIMIYQRVDQVMLRSMVSAEEVGYYAVAVKICALTAFVPMIISRSVFPTLARSKKRCEREFNEKIQLASGFMFWGMCVIAIGITLFIRWPFQWIYGLEFIPAVPIIQILTWKSVFSGIGLISGEWILINGLQRLTPIRSVVALAVNIILNYFMIPILEGLGAAIASLIAVFINSFLMLWIIRSYQPCAGLLLNGILLPFNFRSLKCRNKTKSP